MPKYIERDALEVALNHRLNFLMAENGEYDHYTSGFDEAVTRVEDFPTADVAPVRHGRWIMKHKHRGGFRRYTGIDDMGEPHTITVDERVEYDDRYCSECGKQSADNFLNYCPNCGAIMDLED